MCQLGVQNSKQSDMVNICSTLDQNLCHLGVQNLKQYLNKHHPNHVHINKMMKGTAKNENKKPKKEEENVQQEQVEDIKTFVDRSYKVCLKLSCCSSYKFTN